MMSKLKLFMFLFTGIFVFLSCKDSCINAQAKLAMGGDFEKNTSTIRSLFLCKVIEKELLESIKDDPYQGSYRCVLEVQHVFDGDLHLRGKQIIWLDPSFKGYAKVGTYIYPPLQVGQLGIFFGRIIYGNLVLDFLDGVENPTRQGVSDRFQQVYQFAQTIEQYSTVPANLRLDYLKKTARSPVFEISCWAVNNIQKEKQPDESPFLLKLLLEDNLPLKTQIKIDEILTQNSNSSWLKSDERTRILENWISGNPSESDFNSILSRYDAAAQHNKIDMKLFLKLIHNAVEIQSIEKKFRKQTFRMLYFPLTRGYLNEDDAFEFLTTEIINQNDSEIRIAAIYSLAMINLTPDKLIKIEKLKETLKDKVYLDAFDLTIREIKKQKSQKF